MSLSINIGFIGGGNMASAIFQGIIEKDIVNTNQIFVSGPNLENLKYFESKGASITKSNAEVVISSDIIFICTKPQKLNSVVTEIIANKYQLITNKIFVSILAGTSIAMLEKAFQTPNVNLVRVMPNTPMAVGEGCCVYALNQYIGDYCVQDVHRLLESTGLCIQVPESQIDAMGAVSGSGPAFMYLVIEALADGAVKMGVPRKEAITLAAQTMLGAAKMVLKSGKHSAKLKDEVCSPGGTTIAGIHALEKSAVRSAFMDAVEATTKKVIELGQATSQI